MAIPPALDCQLRRPAYYVVSSYFDAGGGPCPGLACGYTIWGLLIIGGIWLGVAAIVLKLWRR